MNFVIHQHPNPKSVHCPKGDDVLKEHLQDAALVARAYGRISFGERRQSAKTIHTAKTSNSKISEIEKLYKFDEKVKKYLFTQTVLVDFLIEASGIINEFFGGNLTHSLIFPEQSKKLFVEIQAHLDFEQAMEIMDDFDKNWWFKQSREIRSKLEFSLDIQ